MNTKYLETLEYNKIIEMVSNYCKTYMGKDKLMQLTPCFNSLQVTSLLNQTTEAMNLVYRKSNIPLADIPNIELWIKQLESFSILSIKALLEVASILKISRELKEYFFSDDNFDVEAFPILLEYFSSIYTNKSVEEKIFNTILDETSIADDSSSKLLSLRRQSKKLEQEIRNKLTNMIHSSTYSKYMMEPIVTIRNNRYVIPIKEEYKHQIKGFIHDVSSSGSTVFIEPLSIFEMNNQITNIKMEESIEIEKILQELSSTLYPYVDSLKANLGIMETLDVIFAKANFSIFSDSTMPIISEKKQINLIKARHPLIPKETVVPIDIYLGQDYRTLVVTGPNTGGKTVTLKTVGLILLMAYSGLYIPCKENSSIYIFDHIFADIGDEQSIQESLSTFSSHMSNIVEINSIASNNSLILLDELGSGTDPAQGANLAISILEYFHKLGALTICTTHYPELKNYCLVTDGFENASSEFDIEKLQPTYKLLIGIPGKSNAFAISKKLGLNSEILARANHLMKNEEIHIEELLKHIYDDKQIIEKEKEKIQKNSNQIESLRKSLEKELQSQKEQKQVVIEKSKLEARNILLSAKEEANEIIRELVKMEKENNQNQLSTANRLRNKINNKLKEIDNTSSNTLNLEVLKSLNTKEQMTNSTLPHENISTNKKKNSSVTFSKSNTYKSQNLSSEINVIGLNVDEAIFIIDKYIDDCIIAKLSPIHIIHGKGTGKLRQGIHTYLKTNPHVKSYRLGAFGEGEMGVTVIELQ